MSTGRKPARAAKARNSSTEYLYEYSVWISSSLAKRKRLPGDPGRLVGEAADVDFDPAFGLVVEGQVLEPIDVEIAVELAVDAFEEVEVERGGHPGSVVVGGLEDVRLLLQIDADQHFASRPEDARVVGEKSDGGIRLEIADRRAGENPTRFPPAPGSGGSGKGRV